MLVPSIFNHNFADDFFNDFFDFPRATRDGHPANVATVMQTDVKDNGAEYELGIELPGFKKEEVVAELKDGYLTINAEHAESNEEKDNAGRYIRKERYTGHCSRSFYVGEDINEDDIKAKFENGVLTLTIPKEKEKPAIEERKMISIEG